MIATRFAFEFGEIAKREARRPPATSCCKVTRLEANAATRTKASTTAEVRHFAEEFVGRLDGLAVHFEQPLGANQVDEFFGGVHVGGFQEALQNVPRTIFGRRGVDGLTAGGGFTNRFSPTGCSPEVLGKMVNSNCPASWVCPF